MLWKKHLTQVLAFQSRAKQLEEAVKFKQAFNSDILPSQLIHKLSVAKHARDLYTKAHRMSALLEETQTEPPPIDIAYLTHSLENSIVRLTDMIRILDQKASKFGVGDENPPMYSGNDLNASEDNTTNADLLKEEIRHSLKALANILDYMEKPTLLKIRKEIDRLVNY